MAGSRSDLTQAVVDAARIVERRTRDGRDVEVAALYWFEGPGRASVVWIDRDDAGRWSVRRRDAELREG